MSNPFRRSVSTYCGASVLLLGICNTSSVWADEPAINDVPPPTTTMSSAPAEPTQTSIPPQQEPWHVVASDKKSQDASTDEPRYHSNAQRIAGGILIGLGGASLLGFTVVTAAAGYSSSHYNGEGAGLLFVFVGLPLLAGGIMCESIGIPLYLSGSKPPERGSARATTPPPMRLSVGVGPQSATLRLTF